MTTTNELQTFEIKAWVRSGPRNQTNCMNGWGYREYTVKAKDEQTARESVRNLQAKGDRNNPMDVTRVS